MRMSYDDEDVDRLLRGLPSPGVPPEGRARHLEQLRAAMAASAGEGTAEPQPAASRPRTAWTRRRRIVVSLSTAGVVLVGGTAAAAIAWERASVRSQAHCFPFATTDFYNPAYGPDTTQSGGDSARSAVDACRATWAAGLLSSTPPYTGSGVPASPPPLVACVLPDGVVGVFPGDGATCGKLGLPQSVG
jgi:hypothetical protein